MIRKKRNLNEEKNHFFNNIQIKSKKIFNNNNIKYVLAGSLYEKNNYLRKYNANNSKNNVKNNNNLNIVQSIKQNGEKPVMISQNNIYNYYSFLKNESNYKNRDI